MSHSMSHLIGAAEVELPTSSKHSVLVVEDDPTVAEVVVAYLEREGYAVTWKADGAQGLQSATTNAFDIVVLDLMLPTIDGIEVCRRIRNVSTVPVVMLTARGDEDERILGLDVGADDYLAKPFSPRELVARIKAVLRRSSDSAATSAAAELVSGDLRIDVVAHEVTLAGRRVDLTSREFDLLCFLAARPRVAFTREQLLENVWGYTYGDPSTVTVHIRRLREKTEADPSNPERISTVWGVGYRWDG